jgi:hypothetical protein
MYVTRKTYLSERPAPLLSVLFNKKRERREKGKPLLLDLKLHCAVSEKHFLIT